jgi:hypothetical protein
MHGFRSDYYEKGGHFAVWVLADGLCEMRCFGREVVILYFRPRLDCYLGVTS